MTKVPLKEIPIEFILSNLTPYQRELFELKYYVFNRFAELRKDGIKRQDIYYIISEEVSLQPVTINKICDATIDNLILTPK